MSVRSLTFLFLFITFSAVAHAIKWIPGVVILRDESVKSGEISLQPAETVLFRNSYGEVTVYPAHQVHSFRYHDVKENINRVFVSRIDLNTHLKSYHFYESVVSGWINVFRKVKNSRTPISEGCADEFNYYVEWSDRWITLKHFRQVMYPVIQQSGRTSPHLSKELKGLNPNRCDEALKMIILYNQNYAGTSMAGI
jgi:hypothetical protein